jgi:mannosylglycoprotein endo-beta-mannosidase
MKNYLKGWGANIRGKDKKKKQDLHMELDMLEDLEEKGCISRLQACRKSQIQIELLTLLEKEEAFWQQRSRENWLLQGDNNTRFFHRIANGRKRKRTMFSLKDGDRTIQGTSALMEHATDFYKQLFGPVVDSGVRLDGSIGDENEKLNENDINILNTPFTEEEIHHAISQWRRTKQLVLMVFPLNSTNIAGVW